MTLEELNDHCLGGLVRILEEGKAIFSEVEVKSGATPRQVASFYLMGMSQAFTDDCAFMLENGRVFMAESGLRTALEVHVKLSYILAHETDETPAAIYLAEAARNARSLSSHFIDAFKGEYKDSKSPYNDLKELGEKLIYTENIISSWETIFPQLAQKSAKELPDVWKMAQRIDQLVPGSEIYIQNLAVHRLASPYVHGGSDAMGGFMPQPKEGVSHTFYFTKPSSIPRLAQLLSAFYYQCLFGFSKLFGTYSEERFLPLRSIVFDQISMIKDNQSALDLS